MNPYPPRRQHRAMNLTAHVLHIIKKHLAVNANMREISRELEDLFYAAGAEVITEADRINAGLMPRDHNGLTLEELKILDARYLQSMLAPLVMPIFPKDII